MKNQHVGNRAFILGNGPGLDLYDLGNLDSEFTFGSNLIYRRYIPDYYFCCNPLVLDLLKAEGLPLGLATRRSFVNIEYTTEPIFQIDPSGPFWQGYTVTYVALQLAFIMGFDPVYLMGCDHDYGTLSGDPNDEQVHRYSGTHAVGLGYLGNLWNLPDLEKSYQAYKLAAETFAAAGRSIYIIPPTKLDLFEEVSWLDLFQR